MAQRLLVGERTLYNQPGLQLWLRARGQNLADQDGVATAVDWSGKGRHIAQAAAGSRPIWTASELGGHPAFLFDGTDDFLQADAIASLFSGTDIPHSIYAVWQSSGGGGGSFRYLWSVGSTSTANPFSGGRIHQTTQDMGYGRKNTSGGTTINVDPATTFAANTPVISAWIFNGSTIDIWQNAAKVSDAVSAAAGAMAVNTFSIGALRRTTTSNYFRTHIGDLLAYTGAHTEAQRQRIMAALGQLYGIATDASVEFSRPVLDDWQSLTRYLFAVDGNSQSVSDPVPTGSGNWTKQIIPLIGDPPYALRNKAQSGQTISEMIADQQDTFNLKNAYRRNILWCWEGVNAINQGATAAQTLASLQAYCAAGKAAGFEVLLATLLPADGFTPANYDADAATINTALRGHFNVATSDARVFRPGAGGTYADLLVDVAADANLQDPTNATWYYDEVHLTSAGQAVVAQVVANALGILVA